MRVEHEHLVAVAADTGEVVLRCACGWICLLGSSASPKLIVLSVQGHVESMEEAEDS